MNLVLTMLKKRQAERSYIDNSLEREIVELQKRIDELKVQIQERDAFSADLSAAIRILETA